MLDRTNYVALVGGGKQPKFPQNKLIIWDDGKQKVAITLELRTQVYRVRLSRSKIVIALQNSIHIYEFCSPPNKLFVFETADNQRGLCCLGTNIVAFPGQTPGKVQLVELGTGNVSILPAHDTALRAMDLSADGEVLATASEKGTLVKVFSTSNCAKIAELRRGVDPATVFSIKISPDNSFLAATSDKSTLHIFDLPKVTVLDSKASSDPSIGHKWGFLGKIPFMPRAFSDTYSFASVRFESSDSSSTASESGSSSAMGPIPGLPDGRPVKGLIGWLDELTLVVVGTGRDGRWERFVIMAGEDGKRCCGRESWKRYLGR
ncbi:WD repeat domain phosphoinositide-interacting protein 3 [Thelotrema lepadinum]|nr:WD repeat domain phosphoinositide-interacting protein 3 [Thelotrema lepadinum]